MKNIYIVSEIDNRQSMENKQHLIDMFTFVYVILINVTILEFGYSIFPSDL